MKFYKLLIACISFLLLSLPCFAEDLSGYYYQSPVSVEEIRIQDTGNIGQHIPDELMQKLLASPAGYLEELVFRLTEHQPEAVLKLKIIHDWLAYKIKAHMRQNMISRFLAGEKVDILTAIQGNFKQYADYAELYGEMARLAGVPVLYIKGKIKPDGLRGKKTVERLPEGSWNAVNIGGQWYIIDVLADSYSQVYYISSRDTSRNLWFCRLPEESIASHFPGNPEYQFLEQPLGEKEFTALAGNINSGSRIINHFHETGLLLREPLQNRYEIGEKVLEISFVEKVEHDFTWTYAVTDEKFKKVYFKAEMDRTILTGKQASGYFAETRLRIYPDKIGRFNLILFKQKYPSKTPLLVVDFHSRNDFDFKQRHPLVRPGAGDTEQEVLIENIFLKIDDYLYTWQAEIPAKFPDARIEPGVFIPYLSIKPGDSLTVKQLNKRLNISTYRLETSDFTTEVAYRVEFTGNGKCDLLFSLKTGFGWVGGYLNYHLFFIYNNLAGKNNSLGLRVPFTFNQLAFFFYDFRLFDTPAEWGIQLKYSIPSYSFLQKQDLLMHLHTGYRLHPDVLVNLDADGDFIFSPQAAGGFTLGWAVSLSPGITADFYLPGRVALEGSLGLDGTFFLNQPVWACRLSYKNNLVFDYLHQLEFKSAYYRGIETDLTQDQEFVNLSASSDDELLADEFIRAGMEYKIPPFGFRDHPFGRMLYLFLFGDVTFWDIEHNQGLFNDEYLYKYGIGIGFFYNGWARMALGWGPESQPLLYFAYTSAF